MKIINLLLISFFLLCSPSFAAQNAIQTQTGILDGKIHALADGMVVIRHHGAEHTYIRQKPYNYYGDYIRYRQKPYSTKAIEVKCKVTFIDVNEVIFETQDGGRVHIPRYRVQSIVLNFT